MSDHQWRRRFSTLLALGSGVVALGILGAWVCSYRFFDGFYCIANDGGRHWTVQSSRGLLEVVVAQSSSVSASGAETTCGVSSGPANPLMFGGMNRTFGERLGFRYARLGTKATPASGGRIVNVPHWFAFLLFSAYPVWKSTAFLRLRIRARRGLCIGCGYDLRGNRSGHCSECGRKMSSPTHLSEARFSEKASA